ncbi:AAA family ATPase [Streptomyces yaizuensis]|uniref:AAA family ATPase n=1 Tax=Streptomyces yaizuensis TaxID=2989713 RepID=A0ABQ5PBB1_9ACTN|nr:AAA family ATPase [Streptomyces sp. YSPA8]GLF99785.1 AAA family ATPase [Streptomyces sp. YSPA8]
MGAIRDKGRKLQQIDRVSYNDAFLIGDLLTNRITVLAGEPKAGKTLLSAGMVTALVNGETTFLGLPVHRPVRHVVFGLTDDGAEEELKERLLDTVPDNSVTIFPVEHTGEPGYWAGVLDDLVSIGADLFVLDNVVGSLASGEDIASSVTAQRVIDNLKPISRAGIPVLVITHTPKGTGEGTSTASAPIGGRAMAGGARGVIALRKSSKHGRRIQTAINRAREDLDLRVTVRRASTDSEVPVWEKEGEGLKPTPLPQANKWSADLAARIVREQPDETTHNALAKRYAPALGKTPDYVRKTLAPLLTHTAGRWQTT